MRTALARPRGQSAIASTLPRMRTEAPDGAVNTARGVLCFYVGYTPDLAPSDRVGQQFYGAELATVRLAEQLTRFYDVYVFGALCSDADRNGVHYRNSDGLNDFQRDHVVDVMIISRYVHYFLEFTNRAAKTFLWFHDVLAQPYWQFHELPAGATHLVENMMPGIDGLIVLSPWHKEFVLQRYDIDPAKVFVLGNAIDVTLYESPTPIAKVPNRFIYTSAPNRGLDVLLGCFHEIHEQIPAAELYIYRGSEDFSKEILEEIDACGYIHYMGALDNVALAREFLTTDVWFYPTAWAETYCISALEAQMAGCVCVASDVAALHTTVGDRGVLLNTNQSADGFARDAVAAVVDLLNDPVRKHDLQTRGRAWASQQTWTVRASEWRALLESDAG